MVNLKRYNGSCNSLNDLSGEICVPNKTSVKMIIYGIPFL